MSGSSCAGTCARFGRGNWRIDLKDLWRGRPCES